MLLLNDLWKVVRDNIFKAKDYSSLQKPKRAKTPWQPTSMNAVCILVSSSQHGQTHLGWDKHLALCRVVDSFSTECFRSFLPDHPRFLTFFHGLFSTLRLSWFQP